MHNNKKEITKIDHKAAQKKLQTIMNGLENI